MVSYDVFLVPRVFWLRLFNSASFYRACQAPGSARLFTALGTLLSPRTGRLLELPPLSGAGAASFLALLDRALTPTVSDHACGSSPRSDAAEDKGRKGRKQDRDAPMVGPPMSAIGAAGL